MSNETYFLQNFSIGYEIRKVKKEAEIEEKGAGGGQGGWGGFKELP